MSTAHGRIKITAPKRVWLPVDPRKLHRNSFCCQETTDCKHSRPTTLHIKALSPRETAINQIVTNFSDPFYDLSQIMTHIHMNPDYFRKLFKKEMGISPLKYLTQIRISHAKRLLRLKHRSGMSIQEISWLSGFQDSLYFSRVFKKVTGVPPQDWE